MEQREVTDKDNLQWTCVQAYAGAEGKVLEKAEQLAEKSDGKVAVVCTPNGGARSVRLMLDKNWITELPDEELAGKIMEGE